MQQYATSISKGSKRSLQHPPLNVRDSKYRRTRVDGPRAEVPHGSWSWDMVTACLTAQAIRCFPTYRVRGTFRKGWCLWNVISMLSRVRGKAKTNDIVGEFRASFLDLLSTCWFGLLEEISSQHISTVSTKKVSSWLSTKASVRGWCVWLSYPRDHSSFAMNPFPSVPILLFLSFPILSLSLPRKRICMYLLFKSI